MADDIERCAVDDPNRCQGANKFGQCGCLAMPGTEFCKMHSGAQAKKDQKQIHGFLVNVWEARLRGLTDDTGVRSLRMEVGVLKLLLETLINRCQTPDDLLEHRSKFEDLTGKIEKVVLSCNRLEKSTGMMMDKSQALHIAGSIVSIISEHVKDQDTVSIIADEIIKQVLNVEVVT